MKPHRPNTVISANLTSRRASISAAALLLSACATNSAIPDYKPAGPGAAPVPVERRYVEFDLESANTPAPVRFSREDVVRVLLWGYPELTFDATVQADGKITIPMIGEVQAFGKSPAEVCDAIKQILTVRSLPTGPVRLDYEDSVRLLVWHSPELTHVATVQPDGKLVFPLIGEIEGKGRTINEVREEVSRKFAAYVREPGISILPEKLRRAPIPASQVSVLPVKLRPRNVVVLGEVGLPGMVPLQGEARAMDAIAMSHYKDSAQLDDVILIRTPEGKDPQYRRLKLASFMSGNSPEQNIYLMDRDVLVVPKTAIAAVDDFIEKFFLRTRPVFDWWYSLNAAVYARDLFRSTIDANNLLLDYSRRTTTP